PDSSLIRRRMAEAYAAWARKLLPVDRKRAQNLIESSLSLDGDNAEIQELHATLLQEMTKEIVERAMSKARDLESKADLIAAELELRNALQKVPGNTALSAYLTHLANLRKEERDRREVFDLEEQVRKLISERKYPEADELLNRALRQYPDSETLQK